MLERSRPPQRSAGRRHRGAFLLAAALALAVALAWAESLGWPFLAEPVQQLFSRQLQRKVQFDADGARPRFALHLLGGVRLELGRVSVANAAWGREVPLADARSVTATASWRELVAAAFGSALQLDELRAASLALDLQREADGRTNWRTSTDAPLPAEHPRALPLHVRSIALDEGRFRITDATMALDAKGEAHAPAGQTPGWPELSVKASGSLHEQALSATATAGPPAAYAAADADTRLPVRVRIDAGQAHLAFDGQASGELLQATWEGRIDIAGRSLAALGAPLGITLPTTASFALQGRLQHHGTRSQAWLTRATIGHSQLAGDFVFDAAARPRPMLTGELRGAALVLQDLGPAVGVPARGEAPHGARVLPTRPFDAQALKRMDAQVKVRLDRLELGHPRLQSLQPVRAQLGLRDGVLSVDELDAQAAGGRITGGARYDARVDPGRWTLALDARGMKVEDWITQKRDPGLPPYIAGRLSAGVQLNGEGRSTAELLAHSDGRGWMVLDDGRISHLALELAGLDLAQALGVAVRGDDALPVTCAAAQLRMRRGIVQPQLLLLDTRDSTLWADGSLSLADERLDLTAHVAPKDFSPLALRTPLHVTGTLAQPVVKLQKAPLWRKLGPAALLGIVQPWAAWLPLIDPADGKPDAVLAAGLAACHAAMHTRDAVANSVNSVKAANAAMAAATVKAASAAARTTTR